MAVIELTEANFEDTVTQNDFVVVDFWAPWCNPCRLFAPTYATVAESRPEILFAKVNTEVEQRIAAHFEIRSIPTLMIFREGAIIYRDAGALTEGQLRTLLQRAAELDIKALRRQAEQEGGDAPPT